MASLEDHLGEIKQEGLTLGKNGKFYSKAFRSAVEEHGRFAVRRLVLGELESLLEQPYSSFGTKEEHDEKLAEAKKQYAEGKPLVIEDAPFYSNLELETANPLLTTPVVNNVGNTIAVTSLPLSLAARIAHNKYLNRLGSGALPLGMTLKLFDKAYKECMKEERDYSKIIRFTAAGISGALVTSGFTFTNGLLKRYVMLPLMGFYSGMASGLKDRLMKRGTSLYEQLPGINEIRSDIRRHAALYGKSLSEGIELAPVDVNGLKALVREANVFLKHHLRDVKTREIDIEVDHILAPVYSLLEDTPSVGNRFTATVEFSGQALRLLSAPEAVHTYLMSAAFIDNEQNPGRARFRADACLEDLALYCPGRGFDAELMKTRLESIAFTYAEMRKRELADTCEKPEVLEKISEELSSLGVQDDVIDTLADRLYPRMLREAMAFYQKLTANTDVYGHVTHYKLMKAARVI